MDCANDGEVYFTSKKTIVDKEISKMKQYESGNTDDECEEVPT
jgi:hypothetical protein